MPVAQPAAARKHTVCRQLLPEGFIATVQAVEEAIINAMVAAETMTGIDGHTAPALPHDRLREVLRRFGRLAR
ncbi:MAG: hypothetical protein FJW35_01075 [Acidobacteria bacterium]|nr:hypothetical protein [Acidobacteriota bacterium]